jgi:hypothetical protein
MQFFSDYMDEACRKRTGHDNWAYMTTGKRVRELEKLHNEKIAEVIIIFEEDIKEEDGEL